MKGLLAGELHATEGFLLPDQIKTLRNAPNLTILDADALRLFLGVLHNGREPMSDINFRKVLSYVFDYGRFIKEVMADAALRTPTPLPPGIWGAPKGVKGYVYDLEKAHEFLGKMKSPPREITIASITGYPTTEQAALLLQAGLEKIGVKSKLVSEPWSIIEPRLHDEKQMYDVIFLWKSAYYADPNNWIGELYDCDQIGGRNNSWYCNRDVDQLLKSALNSTDQEARRRIYEKAALLVMDDAAGLFVSNTRWFAPYSKKVSGIRFCPIGDGQEMRWASIMD